MSFETAIAQLNPAQKQAIETIEGPVIVIAGPGTGKTHVLTLRIANILAKTDVQPQNILALTFTDSAAQTMRKRLQSLIGRPANNVRIETFHSLADSIIREYPEFFPFKREAQPLTEVEQYTLIRSLLDNPELKFLRTPGSRYHYARELITAISTLKRENVSPERFTQIVKDEASWVAAEQPEFSKKDLLKWDALLGKHQELAGIYGQYQQLLQEKARYDFDDMLLETIQALKTHELLLASLQEQFQYILVDEYQDTNGAQNTMVDLIASFWDQPNLFVVGDPNQTIFRFQGAVLENTLGFLERYPKATVITLETGYRSNQETYNLAHTLVSPTFASSEHPLAGTLQLPLKASHSKGKISLELTATDQEEMLLLVKNIRAILEKGEPADGIGVLYKRNAQGDALADLFGRAQIPFHTEQDVDVLDDPKLQQFLTLLKLIGSLRSASEGRIVFDILGYSWFQPHETTVPTLLLMRLIRSFANQKTIQAPFDFLIQTEAELKKLTALKTVPKQDFQNLHLIMSGLAAWSAAEKEQPLPNFLELIARECGFLNSLEKNQERETIDNFIQLFREVNRLCKGKKSFGLTEFLSHLQTMEEQGLSLERESGSRNRGVTLATIHKAKGREWNHVFLPFFREKYWGKTRSKNGLPLPEGIVAHGHLNGSNEEADERRLLFVALTRTKQNLHLSYSASIREGDRTQETSPSPYLSEFPQPLEPQEKGVEPELASLFLAPVSNHQFDTETKHWLTELAAALPLSYSSLNAYLEDPKLFFERYILKLPQAVASPLAFGNAIHRTLDWYFSEYRKSQTHPTPMSAIKIFDQNLAREILSKEDFESRRNQGHKVLKEYLKEQKEHFPLVLATEESFGWKRGKIFLGDIELTGKIDRIDLTDPDEKRLQVIDYKTGRPKTLGDIEGTTKTAGLTPRELALPEGIRGRMKRQLLFYKLLLSLDSKYRGYALEQGIFEFVEPQKGVFLTRIVNLNLEDLENLKKLISLVSKEIKELKFLDNL